MRGGQRKREEEGAATATSSESPALPQACLTFLSATPTHTHVTMASQFFTRARTIAAIGRNYAAHAKELGNAVPTSPFFFLKPPGCMVRNGEAVQVPKGVEAHFEGEQAVGRDARRRWQRRCGCSGVARLRDSMI